MLLGSEEAGILHGDPDLIGEHFQNGEVLFAKGIEIHTLDVEHADGLAFDFHGHGDFGARFGQFFQGPVARLLGDIVDHQGLPVGRDPTADALHAELQFDGAVRRHLEAGFGPQGEPFLRRVYHQDEHIGVVEGQPDQLDNLLQQLFGVEEGAHLPAHLPHQQQLFGAPFQVALHPAALVEFRLYLLEKPGILDGNGGLVRQRLEIFQINAAESADFRALQIELRQHFPFMDDGENELRACGGDKFPIAWILPDIVYNHDDLMFVGIADEALSQHQPRAHRQSGFLGGESQQLVDLLIPLDLVDEQHGAAGGAGDQHGLFGQQFKDRIDLEGGVDGAPQAIEGGKAGILGFEFLARPLQLRRAFHVARVSKSGALPRDGVIAGEHVFQQRGQVRGDVAQGGGGDFFQQLVERGFLEGGDLAAGKSSRGAGLSDGDCGIWRVVLRHFSITLRQIVLQLLAGDRHGSPFLPNTNPSDGFYPYIIT